MFPNVCAIRNLLPSDAFLSRQNAFSAGVPPRTRWGAYRGREEGLLIEQGRVTTSKRMGRGEGEAHAYGRLLDSL